jgi:hypothetical protein
MAERLFAPLLTPAYLLLITTRNPGKLGKLFLFYFSNSPQYNDELSCRPYLTNELRLSW